MNGSIHIKGSISKVIFFNSDTGYGVVKIKLDPKDKNTLELINKDYITSIDTTCVFDRKPIEGEEYEFIGSINFDPRYGEQFKGLRFIRRDPNTLESVVAYLSSDLFMGVGPIIARKIYDELGPDCLNIIINDKKSLDNIKINNVVKDNIYNGLIENKEKEEETINLLNLGLTMNATNKIMALIPKGASQKIKKNPYILIDIVEGIGFIKADNIALNIGIKKNALIRIKAFINYFLLNENNQTGDTYIKEEDLFNKLDEVLNKGEEVIDKSSFDKAIKALVLDKKIYKDNENNIYNYNVYLSEVIISEFVNKALNNDNRYSDDRIDIALELCKKQLSIEYTVEQTKAIKMALKENISIITGGPGTGKTTIIKAIIESLRYLLKKGFVKEDIALIAPTGRASKRLGEVTLYPSKTIHKFLGYDGRRYAYNENNKVDSKVVIIDEFSMVDSVLCARLFSSLNDDTKIIIVGDVDQLPSVGPGEVLYNLIQSKEVSTTYLTKIHRQDSNSSIISFAHSINNGYIPDDILEKKSDRSFSQMPSSEIASSIITIFNKALESGLDLVKDIQVLIPMYRGKNGIDAINTLLQNELNPVIDVNSKKEIKHGELIFREGDKVIQLINRADKEVMNGDIGYIKAIEREDSKVKIKVSFDNGVVIYNSDEISDLSLAYAISIHKSQGSEYLCAIVPFSSEYRFMLKRKLIYTAVTRAKKYLIMLGSVEALDMGIKGIENHRNTKLLDKIKRKINGEDMNYSFIDSDLSPFDFLD